MQQYCARRPSILNRNDMTRVLREANSWVDLEDILVALDLDPQNQEFGNFASWILEVCERAGLVESAEFVPKSGYICYITAQPEPPKTDFF